MNIPNLAACHHSIRRIWSAVGARGIGSWLLKTVYGAGVVACPVAATPVCAAVSAARDAPVPSNIFRRLTFKVSIPASASIAIATLFNPGQHAVGSSFIQYKRCIEVPS